MPPSLRWLTLSRQIRRKNRGTEAHELQCRACVAPTRKCSAGVRKRRAIIFSAHTALRNCKGDEGGILEFGNQVLISSHRKLLWSKATVLNVAEKWEQDFDKCD